MHLLLDKDVVMISMGRFQIIPGVMALSEERWAIERMKVLETSML